MAMPDLPLNINLIKNVEEIVVFLTRKIFISASSSVASYKQGMRNAQVTFAEKPQMKINSFEKQ